MSRVQTPVVTGELVNAPAGANGLPLQSLLVYVFRNRSMRVTAAATVRYQTARLYVVEAEAGMQVETVTIPGVPIDVSAKLAFPL
jgi:hypothetical protein